MFSRPASHCSIAARQELQMIKIGTTQAERSSLLLKRDHCPREQIDTTFSALCVPANEKHEDLPGLRFHWHRLHPIIFAEVHFIHKGPQNTEAETLNRFTRRSQGRTPTANGNEIGMNKIVDPLSQRPIAFHLSPRPFVLFVPLW
jgi:hypothetical protein